MKTKTRTAGPGKDTAQERRRARRAQNRQPRPVLTDDLVAAVLSEFDADTERRVQQALAFAASGAASLPLSDRDADWDGDAAAATLSAAQQPSGHFWFGDGLPALPFATAASGTLTAVWAAVIAAAGAVQAGIKFGDEAAVKARIGSYYEKAQKKYGDADLRPPWQADESKGETAALLLAYAETDGIRLLRGDDGVFSGVETAGDLSVMEAFAERLAFWDDQFAPVKMACADCGHPAGMHADTDDGDNMGACSADECDCAGFEAQSESAVSPERAALAAAREKLAAAAPEPRVGLFTIVADTGEKESLDEFVARMGYKLTFDTTPLLPEHQPAETLPAVHPSPDAPPDVTYQWTAVLCPEGELTDDGRAFAPGAISWRDLPLTLMGLTVTSAGGGHDGAQVAGRIDKVWRDGDLIRAAGDYDDGEFGQEIARMVGDKTLTGISVDLAIQEYEIGPKSQYFDDDGVWKPDALEQSEEKEAPSIVDLLFGGEDEDSVFVVTDAVIGMATACPFQAFRGATIQSENSLVAGARKGLLTVTGQAGWIVTAKPKSLTAAACPCEPDDDGREALTAAAAGLAPVAPPAEWFEAPTLDGPTPLTVTDDGRIYGHAWAWEIDGQPSCHTAFPSECVTAPHSHADYGYFHTGEIECEDGERISVGRITLDTGHAGQRLGRIDATRHYDDTGTVAAHVVCGEDEFGGWIAGAVVPDLAAEKVRLLRGAPLSGDWRSVNGNLELIALLAVNTPGFPIPRVKALVAAADGGGDEVLSLVAAGLPVMSEEALPDDVRAKVAALRQRAQDGELSARTRALLDRVKA